MTSNPPGLVSCSPDPKNANISKPTSEPTFRAASFGERFLNRSNLSVRAFSTAGLACIAVVLVLRVNVNGLGSLVWASSMVSLWLIRQPFQHGSKLATSSYTHRRGTDRMLVTLNAFCAFVFPLVHLLTGVFNFADFRLPVWMPFISLFGVVPGVLLFRASHIELGRNWSPTTEIIQDHKLVKTGIYKHVRHPMYAGLWLVFGMCPLLIQNGLVSWLPVAAFGVMYFARMHYEEEMMLNEFGEEYRVYCKHIGKLWPLIG